MTRRAATKSGGKRTVTVKICQQPLVSGTAIYESTDVWASVAMLKGE